MATANLRALARYSDSLSQVYLEHAVIEQEGHSIAAFTPEGRITLPAANLSSVILGPGTRITHAAIKVLADCGALVVWTGAEGLAFYACGQSKTRLSNSIEHQARHWADPDLHLLVVRRMYQARFNEPLPAHLTLEQIRGKEGLRVRETYQRLYPFRGRDEHQDPSHRNGSLDFQNDCGSIKKGFRWLRAGDFCYPGAVWTLRVASAAPSNAISTP